MASQQRPTWLNQLPAHSIFELDEQEYLEWTRINCNNNKAKAPVPKLLAKTNNTPFTSFQPGGTSRFSTGQQSFGQQSFGQQSFGLEELQEEYKQANQGLSCMVVYHQDMYVAVGRQIRYTNLSDLKNGVENSGRVIATEYIENKQHKVLKVDNIDFDIRRLIINQDGKLLAIIGDEKVVVAVLPKAIRQNPKAVSCKSFVVGEYYHINKGPSKIVKALWHPLSRGYTHLLVMTHDNILRMYDVGEDFDEPEQAFSFAGEGQTSNTYGLDVDLAASFCFGSKHSLWGPLAIYCLTQSGDVYMMCPIMPNCCVLKVSELESIREQIEGKPHHARTLSKSGCMEREWLAELLESVQPHPFSDEVVIVRNPRITNAKVARQGPFLYQPAPIEPMELEDDDNRAYDILALETEPVGVLVLAYSSGKMDICFIDDPPSARWTFQRQPRKSSTYTLEDDDSDDDGQEGHEEDYLPTLSVYETIDLGILKVFGTTSSSRAAGYSMVENRMSIPNHPVLVADSIYSDIFYVYHDTGAHYVLIKPWLEEMASIYAASSQGAGAGLDDRIIKFYDAKIKSTVGCIVTTRLTRASPPAPIVGFSVVTDAYLEYSLLLLTASLQLVGQELMTRPKMMNVAAYPQLPQYSIPGSKVKEGYQCTLTLPAFGTQDGLVALNGLPLQPKIVLPPGVGSAKITVTEENLQFLNKMARGVRESLREVYTACDVAQQRLVAQEDEYTHQQQEVAMVHERIKSTIQKKMQTQVDRQEAQSELHKKLMARVDELLRKLTETRGPELNSAEKAWAIDVIKSERVVKAFDERRHRVQTQYEILKRRMLEMQSFFHGPQQHEMSGAAETKRQSSRALMETSERGSLESGRQSIVYQRQPTRRYGTSQLQAVESALSVEAQLLDTTMKMLSNVTSRLEVVDISKD
ncbi:hypothetical protein BGZ65_001260 [Modicella reniformis]|uniref:Uncharacterized protein n=1 Tax=Modicella reniformis TaxID=1440133 RepID=A0A9P6M390_9FUNG|nr:hypothetical protein BGZ65_001260 [Modicella reniformis]